VPADLPRDDEFREWYYHQVDQLGLRRTDCEDIFATKSGILACHVVERPEGKTREEAEEFLAFLKWRMGKGPKPPTR
jgi:hypothetical protein